MPEDKQQSLIGGIKVSERHDLSFQPSRPFDFFLWFKDKELDAYVADLELQIKEINPPRKVRPIKAQEKFIFSLKLILLNLLAAEKSTLRTLQAVPRRNKEFNVKTRYDQKYVSFRSFTDAYGGLLELELIKIVTKGFWNGKRKQGKVTRIEPTHKLKKKLSKLFPQDVIYFIRHPDEENIRLRNAKKTKLLEYEDTDYTQTARSNLKTINDCLNKHWYDLRLSDAEFDIMYGEMVKRHKKESKNPASIRLSDRSLYRIYNNGDIPDGDNFKQGGRFYGAWWEGIPSKYRRKIMIDDKPTVEIDYSSYHPRMLYAREGLNLDGRDPYLPDDLQEEWRGFGKLAFTKLLNGKKRLKEPNDYDSEVIGMTWKELLTKMELYHAPIAKYFRTGYGLDLQRKDSDIAEAILLGFSNRNIPCLPVHDSFIVHHAHAEELKNMMEKEYENIFAQSIPTKLDDGFELFTEEYTEQGEASYDIDAILSEDENSQYRRRLHLWLENKDSNK